LRVWEYLTAYPKLLSYTAKLFIIGLITILLGEIGTRIFKPQITFSTANKQSGGDCFANDPLIPFTLRKNHVCKLVDYRGDFNTYASLNSLGFRGKDFSLEKVHGEKRILVLGDSITFGYGVSDSFTYPSLMETLLKKQEKSQLEVINAGFADGLSPDSYYVFLKNRGLDYKPDLIIMEFFVHNDIIDLADNIWEKLDKNGLPAKISSCCSMVENGILRKKQIVFKYSIPFLRESQLFILLSGYLDPLFHLTNNSVYLGKGVYLNGCVFDPECIHLLSPEETKVQKVMLGIKKIAEENHIPFLVALFPSDLQLYPDAMGKYDLKAYPPKGNKDFIQKRLGQFFSENSIAYLDLYPVFDQEKNRGYPFFINDAHLNNIGTQIAAETITDYLLKNKPDFL